MLSIMEVKRSQSESEELEKLLCEIPNVTSSNPQSNTGLFDEERLGKFRQSPSQLGSQFSALRLTNTDGHTGPFGGSFPDLFKGQTFADVDWHGVAGYQISWLHEMQLRYLNLHRLGDPRLNAPISDRYRQFGREQFWDFHAMPRCPNRSNDLRPLDFYPDDPTVCTVPLPLIRYDSLEEVSGRIYLMARDQHGCRFLQRKFSEGTREEVEMIFSEIVDRVVDLMTDPFGNYLVQKLLDVCNEDQRMKILRSVTRKEGELVQVSCDMHGTRVVQKIIETLDTAEQFSMIVSSLEYNAVALMKNINGNHVAQKCLQNLMPEFNSFLFEAAIGNCVELSRDRHGCCVLQKCLGRSDNKERSRLICEVASNSLILSQDPFGNYVVQFVFDLKLPWATEKVLDNLDGSFADLSVQKHSSNVVETCLKSASEERRSSIIRELIENPRFDQIMRDPFGNYVTQVALDKSKGIIYAKLVDAIKPHVDVLRTSPYGKKVLTRLSMKK